MTTLSLEASKKVFEIVGEYETELSFHIEKQYIEEEETQWVEIDFPQRRWPHTSSDIRYIPAPNFAELVRILPKLHKQADRLKFNSMGELHVLGCIAMEYMNAPTEPEGMAAVEELLMKLL